jgi:Na+-driven multidrug efflux pump
LRILALGYFFSGTFRTLSVNLLAAFRRVHFGLFIAVLTSASDIGFNYVFIKNYGMIGAAYATFLVDIISAVTSFGYVIYLLRKGTINEIH